MHYIKVWSSDDFLKAVVEVPTGWEPWEYAVRRAGMDSEACDALFLMEHTVQEAKQTAGLTLNGEKGKITVRHLDGSCSYYKICKDTPKGNRKATHIQWDVDEPEDLESLPTEIDIPDGMTDVEEISDYITDQTGFCHKGFIVEG